MGPRRFHLDHPYEITLTAGRRRQLGSSIASYLHVWPVFHPSFLPSFLPRFSRFRNSLLRSLRPLDPVQEHLKRLLRPISRDQMSRPKHLQQLPTTHQLPPPRRCRTNLTVRFSYSLKIPATFPSTIQSSVGAARYPSCPVHLIAAIHLDCRSGRMPRRGCRRITGSLISLSRTFAIQE